MSGAGGVVDRIPGNLIWLRRNKTTDYANTPYFLFVSRSECACPGNTVTYIWCPDLERIFVGLVSDLHHACLSSSAEGHLWF